MILSERETPKGLLVAVCDSDILGKTFVNGDVSLTVTEEFYGTEEATEEAVISSLSRASVANIVGTNAVAIAIENGFIDKDHVLKVGDTVHAQMLRMA